MTYWLMQNTLCRRIQPLACFLLLAMLVISPSVTQAKKLNDVIPDLYGGDGFQTNPFSVGSRPNDFGNAVFGSFNELTNGIGSQIGQFAVNSTVAAFRFDVERGVPVEVTKSLGPLFAERADTLGKGRFDFQVVWSNANYKKFNGQKLSSLSANVSPTLPQGLPPNSQGFDEQLKIDLDVEVITNFVGFFGTYGITDDWDINVLVPLVHNTIKAKSQATMLDANGVPCTLGGDCSDIYVITPGSGDPSQDSSSGEKTGIGDIFIRTKYNFLKNHEIFPDLGVRGGISLPTGDEDNFMGLGDVKFEGLAVASKYYPLPVGVIGPHINTGIVLVNNQGGQNLFTYVAGFDFAPVPIFAFSLDLLGRHELDDRDNSGQDIIDLAPGMKFAPFPNTLVQTAVQFPLNKNEGLRPDAVWTLGLGGTF
ncbi:MAG: transporter [Nitrospirota bacterium]|nr:transporter [Nitrospirota bacterium]MDH5700358.1 transporter [Nitrospirota bacterium]